MKLACKPHCSNPDTIGAELLLLEISPDLASNILQDAQKCTAFLREMEVDARVESFGGCVSLGATLEFRVYGSLTQKAAIFRDLFGDAEWLAVDDDGDERALFGLQLEETPIHAHCVEVLAGRVYLSATGKLTGERYESQELSFRQLAAIGSGQTAPKVKRVDSTLSRKERCA